MRSLFFVIPVLLFLTGCETFSIKKAFPGMFSTSDASTQKVAVLEPEQALPEDLNEFITFGKDGQVQTLDQSPWGKNREIMVQQSYFSASGRKCRALRLLNIPVKHQEEQFVCEDGPGNWVPLRCISR
jgi:hypothetical protein